MKTSKKKGSPVAPYIAKGTELREENRRDPIRQLVFRRDSQQSWRPTFTIVTITYSREFHHPTAVMEEIVGAVGYGLEVTTPMP